MNIRKIVTVREAVFSEGGKEAATPIHRVAGLGIIENPLMGRFVDDLEELFQIGLDLGENLMEVMLPQLPGPVVSYGKAAIVGVGGDLEHGHAMLHPMLGKAVREPIGGGKAIIPSVVKVAACTAA